MGLINSIRAWKDIPQHSVLYVHSNKPTQFTRKGQISIFYLYCQATAKSNGKVGLFGCPVSPVSLLSANSIRVIFEAYPKTVIFAWCRINDLLVVSLSFVKNYAHKFPLEILTSVPKIFFTSDFWSSIKITNQYMEHQWKQT